jgi:hypothetical protein
VLANESRYHRSETDVRSDLNIGTHCMGSEGRRDPQSSLGSHRYALSQSATRSITGSVLRTCSRSVLLLDLVDIIAERFQAFYALGTVAHNMAYLYNTQ